MAENVKIIRNSKPDKTLTDFFIITATASPFLSLFSSFTTKYG
jgi:hypothetical protein